LRASTVAGGRGCFQARRKPGLAAVRVVVGLASALERDLIVRKLAAFWHRGSLGVRIGLWFRRWLRDLANIDRMSAADWSNHDLVS